MDYFTTPLVSVYIDESGSVMSGAGESNLYICTAVIVSESDRQSVMDGLKQVIAKHKLGKILKSNKIGSDNKRRIEILKDLMSLNFTYVFLMTDKSKFLPDSPLEKYKKSRYKFLHNKLNDLISRKHCNLEIIIDKYGSEDFQKECLAYYEHKNEDLFGGAIAVSYADDEQNTILQIADFIGGSLLYCYDKDRKSEYSANIRELLQGKETGCDFFPRGTFITMPLPVPDDKLIEELYRHLYNKSVALLDSIEDSSDEIEKMQYDTLNSLFLARCHEDPLKQWIYSDKLYDDLCKQGYEIGKRAFTVNIVGGLRRKGIIIAGSPNGYKLALTLADIDDYLLHDNNIIFPMLDKLKLAKDTVKSLIQFDILRGEYTRFATILGALTNEEIQNYTAEPDIEKISMIEDKEDK